MSVPTIPRARSPFARLVLAAGYRASRRRTDYRASHRASRGRLVAALLSSIAHRPHRALSAAAYAARLWAGYATDSLARRSPFAELVAARLAWYGAGTPAPSLGTADSGTVAAFCAAYSTVKAPYGACKRG